MSGAKGQDAPSGPQIIVESLYALLAVASVILFSLREMSSLQGEIQHLAELAVAATVFALLVLSVLTGSFVVLAFESAAPDANIRTAEDALWWAVSTVFGAEPAGFGDHYTVTTPGRIVSLWLLILSLGLIGSLAGMISAWIEEGVEAGAPGRRSE